MSLTKRIISLVIVFGIILSLYSLSQNLAFHFNYLEGKNLTLPLEKDIPLLPNAIWIYLLAYFTIPLSFAPLINKDAFITSLKTFMKASLIHSFFFICFPMTYDLRPDLIPDTSLASQLLILLHKWDQPLNNYPSMHVSFAFLSYFILLKFAKSWAWVYLALAILISASTVLVKQHYIMDVLGGITLASGLAWLDLFQKPKTFKITDKHIHKILDQSSIH